MKVRNWLCMLHAMILFTLVSFSITAQAIEIHEIRTAKFISCDNLSQRQIGAKVKNDFIQTRLPYWDEDKKLLGPKVVVWINNNNITPIQNGYKILLIVRGARKDLNYQVIVNCQNETVSYQIDSH